MSSILDALNKSDAERRRGQLPTLGSHLPPTRRPPPRRRRPWLLPVIAVLALAGAWFGGLFDRDHGEGAPATSAESGTVPEATTEIAATGDPEPPSATPATAPLETVAEPSADASAPAPPPTRRSGRGVGFGPFPPAQLPAQDDTAGTPAADREPASTAAASPAPVEPAHPEATTPSAQQPPQTVTDAQPPPTQPPLAASGAEPEPGTASLVTSPPPAPAAAMSGAVPSLHELPFSVRRTLPEIAVTMHMFNADPERRFALINGTRVRDGQPLEGGLEVIAIRLDGIVLRHDGTEFLYPIR